MNKLGTTGQSRGRTRARGIVQPRVVEYLLCGEIMRTIIPLYAVLTLCLCTLVKAETNVRDLNPPARVTGLLGKPLGTRMIIAGIMAEVLLANPLAVSEIDGHTLKQSVSLTIRGKVQIQKSTRYRLEGYESGGFAGPPDWTSGATVAQQPFQFYSVFVVTKVIETKSQ